MIQERICRECGRSFKGGPRAYYCPSCRADRALISQRESKARARKGLTRRLGSIDKCERCGKDYEIAGANQRFCPECQPIHALEYDRETALPFYHANKKRINPPRKLKRRKRSNICLWCGKDFDPINGSTTCSDECKRLLANKHTRDSYQRTKERNAPLEEVYDMSRIAREIGKHKGTVRIWHINGKLPAPNGFSQSGRPFWYRSTILHILTDGGDKND